MKPTLLFVSLFSVCALQAQTFSWMAQESGVDVLLMDVYFIDDQEGWVVGDGGTILHTADGGQTWDAQTNASSEMLNAVQFVTSTKGWAAGGQTEATLLQTTDGGATWTAAAEGIVENQVLDIAFSSSTNGWAITRNKVYVTTGGSGLWELEDYESTVGMGLAHGAITATSDTSAYIATRFDREPGDPPAAVLDNQTSLAQKWSEDAGGEFVAEDELRTICFSDDVTGFAGGALGVIYKMASDGESYNGPWEFNFDTGSGASIRGITFPTAENGSFCTTIILDDVISTLTYTTGNTGANWAMPDTIPGLDVRAMHAPDPETIWAVGDGGQIYKGTLLNTAVPSLSMEGSFVHPTLFHESLNVDLGETISQARTITIIDGSGRMAYTRNVANATGIVQLNGLGDLSAGIYMLVVSGNDGPIMQQRVVKN